MRVVVLGGTWFIGRAICAELAKQGHQILVAHRGQSEPADPVLDAAVHLHADRARWPEQRAAFAAFEPDAAVDVSAGNGDSADCALRALPPGLRLVALSSVDVYRAFESARLGTDTDAVPLTESAPLRRTRFLDSPAWENLDVEDRYLAAGAAVLRLSAVYGEHDYQHRAEFVLRRLRAGRSRMPIGAGTFLCSRVYVRDVATAVLAALEHPDSAGQVYNLAESATASMRMFAEQIAAAAGARLDLVQVPDAVLPPDLSGTAAGAQHLLFSAAKAVDQLKWRESDPVAALRRTVRWHLANPPAEPDPDFSPDDAALEHLGPDGPEPAP